MRNKARDHRDYRNVLIRLEAAFLLQLELIFRLTRKALCREMIMNIGVCLGIVIVGVDAVYDAAELIATGFENMRETVRIIRVHYLLRISARYGGDAVGERYRAL